jgi:hypothetical protein
MKKILLLTLVSIFVFASMSSAAMKVGVMAPFGVLNIYNSPILVITPGNVKDVNYDVLLSYWSAGNGPDIETNTGMLIGGTWWTGMNGPINYGWTAIYLTQGTASGLAPDDKVSDNNITVITLVFSAKTQLVQALDLRADVRLLDSVSGKDGGVNISSANRMLGTMQLSLQYNFTI